MRIEIVKESVVFQKTDAIVNAANATMLGGGAVDGAIHDAAGPELYEFFNRQRKMWKAGDVEISPGFNTNAKYILHAVGPIWHGGNEGEAEKLKSCYVGCLEKAAEAGCASVAFCCISVGVYHYPLEAAVAFYNPQMGRWMTRDPIEEKGGENLYAFCFSNPLTFYDSEGALVLTGPLLVPPQEPHWWDQLGSGTGPFNEEQWFKNRYPHLLAEARQRFIQEINDGIDCSKDVFNGKSSRINLNPGVAGDWPWQDCVGGDDSRFGDQGQSSWEAIALLGSFSVDYVTPVDITYTCERGKRMYHWTTTMYVSDVLGLQGGEGWLGKFFGWAAKSRQVKRAQWTLAGSGECKKGGK